MSKYCPIVNRKVIYQFCEDCESKICKENNTTINNIKREDLVLTKDRKKICL